MSVELCQHFRITLMHGVGPSTHRDFSVVRGGPPYGELIRPIFIKIARFQKPKRTYLLTDTLTCIQYTLPARLSHFVQWCRERYGSNVYILTFIQHTAGGGSTCRHDFFFFSSTGRTVSESGEELDCACMSLSVVIVISVYDHPWDRLKNSSAQHRWGIIAGYGTCEWDTLSIS